MSERWTAETAHLAARALYDWTQTSYGDEGPETGSFYDLLDPAGEPAHFARKRAASVLSALADAGLLAAPTSPSQPVPSTPRVWAMPEIPEDVKAVRDNEGSIWHRAEEPERWWDCEDGRRISAESRLIDERGPLTEVEETNDGD